MKGKSSVRHSLNGDGEYVEVEAARLDDVLGSLRRIDWVKIDVEGCEYEVLEGMKKILTKHKPKLIVEIRWDNMEKTMKFLEKMGYSVKKINDSICEEFFYVFAEHRR